MELTAIIDSQLNLVDFLATNPSYQQNVEGTSKGDAFVLRDCS